MRLCEKEARGVAESRNFGWKLCVVMGLKTFCVLAPLRDYSTKNLVFKYGFTVFLSSMSISTRVNCIERSR